MTAEEKTITLKPEDVQRLVAQCTGVPPSPPTTFQKALQELLQAIGQTTLRQLVQSVTFSIGDLLLRQGEQGDFMYLILSGRVLAFSGNLRNPMVLGVRGVGEFIGEMSMIDNQPRSANVVAIEPVRALLIKREAFNLMLRAMPELNLRLMQSLSLRLRQAEAQRGADQRSERLVRRQVERLTQAKSALETNRQMLNFIIHDLRNPLNVIMNVLEMLEMLMPDEAAQENQDLFSMGHQAVKQSLNLIESLLDLARYEAGQLVLQFSTFELAEMIQNVVAMQQCIAHKKQITLEALLAPELPAITADRARIERVLINLLDNALKHTPYAGTVQVRAQLDPTAEAKKPCVRICVTDTGPGVPAEARERIFELHVQLDTSHGGLGLGLNYCRLTVQAHGGRIWVEDGVGGVGSCFVFTLPLKQE